MDLKLVLEKININDMLSSIIRFISSDRHGGVVDTSFVVATYLTVFLQKSGRKNYDRKPETICNSDVLA